MTLEVVLLVLLGVPIIMDSLISLQSTWLRYKIEMKRLDPPEEDEEGPVGFHGTD